MRLYVYQHEPAKLKVQQSMDYMDQQTSSVFLNTTASAWSHFSSIIIIIFIIAPVFLDKNVRNLWWKKLQTLGGLLNKSSDLSLIPLLIGLKIFNENICICQTNMFSTNSFLLLFQYFSWDARWFSMQQSILYHF